MGYDLASLRKIQRSNSHLSERRYCLEGMEDMEPVQKVERFLLELMEEAEERQKEGEANLMINGLSQSVQKINHKERWQSPLQCIEADLAALERAGKTIIASYGCT